METSLLEEVAPPLRTPSSIDGVGIVAFSHLRWNFVWQRPQQFLSRFAARHPVLFIEEPMFDLPEGREPTLEMTSAGNGISVAVPHLASNTPPESTSAIQRQLAERAIEFANGRREFDQPILWFYSPMMSEWALDIANSTAIVYDCMDELSQFRFAPPNLIENEQRLLCAADVVFTGGIELFDKKSKNHGFTHCFGCGVEFEHFAKAQESELPTPEDLDSITKPIVGWFGVIDERVDYELLRSLSTLRPDINFVMVGPVVKVDPASLPQAPNLHWLGSKTYAELPDYCRGFDVCMMCFALNEATEFINPTKALEYFATGKPVISTPVRDVVRQYSHIAAIASNPEDFASAIDAALNGPDRQTIDRGIELARHSSWDATVMRMSDLIAQAAETRADANLRSDC